MRFGDRRSGKSRIAVRDAIAKGQALLARVAALAAERGRAETAEKAIAEEWEALNEEVTALSSELDDIVLEAGRELLHQLAHEVRLAGHTCPRDAGPEARRAYSDLVALLKTLLIPIIVPDLSPGPQRDELFGTPPEEQVIGFFKIIGRHLPADIVPAAEDLDALGRLWDDVNNLEAFIERERLGA